MRNLAFLAAAAMVMPAALWAVEEPSEGGAYSSAAEQIGQKVLRLKPAPREVIRDWPKVSKRTAEVLLEKYGQPDDFNSEVLVWRNKGPWTRMIVHREPWGSGLFRRKADVLQQCVRYSVPLDKLDALARFDSRVVALSPRNELCARTANERRNHIALNLADEIISGWKTPREARTEFRRMRKFADSGKESHYTQALQF